MKRATTKAERDHENGPPKEALIHFGKQSSKTLECVGKDVEKKETKSLRALHQSQTKNA